MTQVKLEQEPSSTTALNLRSFEVSCNIFLEQLKQLEKFPLSELRNMLGPDGKPSMTELIDILTQWCVISSKKEREKLWTLIADSFMLPIQLGER
jgi:hypothetical protein